ncbi:MAG TPA: DUF6010 family protein [Pyrinomonadaceae bacterium]|jgi:hypothetical protein|nr:DUF6010 family protein [Pyrinomonadaceae bacterium]
MRTVVELLLGVPPCLALIALARRAGARAELTIYALSLAAAALIYVGFAFGGGATRGWLGLELAGVVLFSLAALLGVRVSAWFLAAGWAAHAAWDALLHTHAGAPFVPDWYRAACAGFDLTLAAYLALRRERTRLDQTSARGNV